MLKYLHFQLACDIAFGVFMLTWFVARHILYLIVTYSVYAHVPEIISYGCYSGHNGAIIGPFPPPDRIGHLLQPFRDPEGVICWNGKILWTFLAMLIALQVIALIWFGMIMRVAWRVIHGGTAEDSRSDDEEEEEEEYHDDEREGEVKKKSSRRRTIDTIDGLDVDVSLLPLEPLEEEVGVEAINFYNHKGRNGHAHGSSNGTSPAAGRRSKKPSLVGGGGGINGGGGGGGGGGGVVGGSSSSSSGATLPGHSDRKELLGRIGCDKSGLD